MKEATNSTSVEAELISNYNLGTVTSIEGINHDTRNFSYRIKTSTGDYFLREHYHGTSLNIVQSEAGLINFLGANGIPVPKIIENNHGELVFNVKNRFGFVCEYVAGDFYPGKQYELNNSQLISSAETLAGYHLFIQGYNQIQWIPAKTTNFTVENFFSRQKAKEIWNIALSMIASRNGMDIIDNQLALTAREKLAQIESIDDFGLNDGIKQLPALLAHGDYVPQNLIFLENKTVAIVDWEMARLQPRVWELVRAMCAFCRKDPTEIFNTPIDISRAKLFIETYEKINSLTQAEKMVMFDLAYIGSLYPIFILKSRYVGGNNSADFLMPINSSYWNWWAENRILVRNFIFGF